MSNPSKTDFYADSGATIGTIRIFSGSGAPAIAAPKGSLYLRTDGSSTSTRIYVCQTANTATTGAWTNVTTAA